MEKYWGGKSAFYILKWINSSHIYLNINIYCVRSITVLKDRTWANVLSVFWFTCCRTTCSSTHHFIYTHIETHLMDPSKTWLHIFITSTRNLINQQINSLLMEAACWWRQLGDGGSSAWTTCPASHSPRRLTDGGGPHLTGPPDHILLDHRVPPEHL